MAAPPVPQAHGHWPLQRMKASESARLRAESALREELEGRGPAADGPWAHSVYGLGLDRLVMVHLVVMREQSVQAFSKC